MTQPLTPEMRAGTPGEVRAGLAQLGGRPVILIRADSPDRKGALTPDDGDTLSRAMEMALDKRLPVVLLLASSGADAHHGVAALDGWGRAARALSRCSGVVPVLAGVTGPAVSGSALLIGMADVVVMADDSYAFVSGPIPVREMTGVTVGLDELGGADVHHRSTGAAQLVVPAAEVLDTVAEILSYLPNHNDELPPVLPTDDPVDRLTPDAGEVLPETSTGSYDVRHVIRAFADDDEFLELRGGWAPNLVTGFTT